MSAPRYLDITLPLGPGLPVYPGDPPVALHPHGRLRADDPDSFQSSRLELGSHSGTHLDAPRHLFAGAAGVDEATPDLLCGPARVLDLRGRGPRLSAEDLAGAGLDRVERLLLRTDNGALLDGPYRSDFVHLTPRAAEYLVTATAVRLVGIDYLSIEAADAAGLPVHRRLLGCRRPVWILEALDLRQVAAGDYLLWCLPLRIPAGDGSPARAFLGPRLAPGESGGPEEPA